MARILIVDDEVGMVETMRDLLELYGHKVFSASDGYEALDLVRDQRFDVIFMDIKMPGIDGVDTYKQVKELRLDAVVMMMTAYSVEDLVAEALKEGAYGVMYKPLDIEEAVKFIDKIEDGGLVLVTDDDPATCETLIDVLMQGGHRIGIAKSGEEATRVTNLKDFDIILIDVKMPVMNGLETYRKLKKLKPDVRAVMITGYPGEVGDLAEQALNENAYTVLYKPFEPEKLLRVVEMIMEGRSKEEVQNISSARGEQGSTYL